MPRAEPIADVRLRWMIRVDLPQVTEIDARSFGGDAWPQDRFVDELRERNVIGMVAEADTSVVGFMVYQQRPDRLFVRRFAVHPDRRRRGVGSAMLAKLKEKLTPSRRRAVRCRVGEWNDAGIAFLAASGFRGVGVERGAADDAGDVYVFEVRLATPSKERSDG